MLNKRQREFRKRMKEVEKGKQNRNNIYSYRNQRFENERPRKRYKKPLLQIGGAVGLLVLLWNLYVFSSYLIPWDGSNTLLSANQIEVHQYIQESSQTEAKVHEILNSLMEQYNANSLTVFHIEEAQQKLFELQKEGETDDPRFLAMKAYLDDQFALAYQMTNVLKTRNSDAKYIEMEQIITNQNALLARRNTVLTNILESEEIPYEQKGDGSISYEYEI